MGNDCSYVKRSAFRSKNYMSFEYDHKNKNGGQASTRQRTLKAMAVSAKHRFEFVVLDLKLVKLVKFPHE